MQYREVLAAWAVTMGVMPAPAQACIYSPPLDPSYVRNAEVVVAGRIVNYRIVRDQQARRERRVLEARWPGLSPQAQRRRAQRSDFLTDFAQFDVIVEQVFVGHAPQFIPVRWDNSTFNEPQTLPGRRYLVALRRLPVAAPSREPNGNARPNPWSGAMIPLQASCSTAFIFEEGSADALRVIATLSLR